MYPGLGYGCAHCGQVAEINGQRAMSNRVSGHEPPIEMDAFDLRVGGQHLVRASLRLNHRGIVAGADHHPRRHRDARPDAGDERTFADVSDSECGHEIAGCGAERGEIVERTLQRARTKEPRFAVWGGRMNLRKQVEPLLSVALQASSKQRHAQRATSQLTWD